MCFGNPGYRLGYAKDATNSYFVFKTLREIGVIPRGVRFQISMPMVNSVVRPMTFPDPADLARIRPGYEAAIAAEPSPRTGLVAQPEDLGRVWHARRNHSQHGEDGALERGEREGVAGGTSLACRR